MNNYNDLKDIVLPYLKEENTIGFSISGGFDSAVLLWCCLNICKEENIIPQFSAYSVKRGDNSEYHSRIVVSYLKDLFEVDIPHHYVGDPDQHHSRQTWSGIQEAMLLVDYVFIGDTAVPDELAGEWMPKRERSPDNCVQPFFDWFKDRVVALAIEKNLTDIMKISHTCTERHHERCGICWQCTERSWAFSRNGYTDPGTL